MNEVRWTMPEWMEEYIEFLDPCCGNLDKGEIEYSLNLPLFGRSADDSHRETRVDLLIALKERGLLKTK